MVSNGYIFNRIVLTSIDDQGNQIWWKTYGEDFHNFYAGGIRGCTKTSDGGFAMSGSIEDEIRSFGLLMKFDQDGDSVWSKIYGDTLSPDYASDNFYVCEQLPDKGYLLAGMTYISGNNGDIWLIRTDSSGNTLWENTYGELQWIECGFSVALLPDGNFLIGINRDQVGITTKMDPGLLKIDSLGNLIWIKYYGWVFDDGQAQVILSQDGNYIVGSTFAVSQPNEDYPEHKAWVFKTDTAGNILWERKYSNVLFTGWCSAITELGDGNLVISGSGGFLDYQGTLGWILKTNAYGDSIWMRRYSLCPGWENHLNDHRITSDDGIIITGMTWGYPDWEQSIWVQKLDSNGCDTAGCDPTIGIAEASPMTSVLDDIMTYPNPASDWIHILFKENRTNSYSDRYIEIFNTSGVKVMEKKTPLLNISSSFDISSLPQGLYLLSIKERQKVIYTRKFLIAR